MTTMDAGQREGTAVGNVEGVHKTGEMTDGDGRVVFVEVTAWFMTPAPGDGERPYRSANPLPADLAARLEAWLREGDAA